MPISRPSALRRDLYLLRRDLQPERVRNRVMVRRQIREVDASGVSRRIRPSFAGLVRSRGASGPVWAVTMVKDEVDVIGFTIEHLLGEGVAHVVVADNLSSDGTRDVLLDWARTGRVTVLDDRLFAYLQADKMTHLARYAACRGAGWIIPFDADELWFAPGSTLREFLGEQRDEIIAARPIYNQLPAPDDDPNEPNPYRRLRHRAVHDLETRKVAFRSHLLAALRQGNHSVYRPGTQGSGLEIRHVPHRSSEQFFRKVRNGHDVYEAVGDVRETVGWHWRWFGSMSDDELESSWDTAVNAVETVVDPAPFRPFAEHLPSAGTRPGGRAREQAG